ncbi:competence type IV pilus major pilin ComGC [Furfurilactobacillus siliginis]|uniref:competence type IV pilus major pilin ComGC n=1 Tax=Furfurilactobacillus siliginis TaxID=348151 RepID=UPI00353171D6
MKKGLVYGAFKRIKAPVRQGFTLIEMAVVLFVISLLILIILPNISDSRRSASKTHNAAFTQVIQTQVDLYQNDNGDQSVTFAELGSGKYLTDKQIAKAKAEGIEIHDNVVEKK